MLGVYIFISNSEISISNRREYFVQISYPNAGSREDKTSLPSLFGTHSS